MGMRMIDNPGDLALNKEETCRPKWYSNGPPSVLKQKLVGEGRPMKDPKEVVFIFYIRGHI